MSARSSLWLGLLALLAFGSGSPVQAQVLPGGDGETRNLIEIGGGALGSTDQPLEALVRVEFENHREKSRVTRYVRVRLTAEAAFGADGASLLDVQFDALGTRGEWGGSYLELDLFSADLQRNVAIDQDLSIRFGVLGVRGEGRFWIDDGVRWVLAGALDLLGISYTRRLSDGAEATGYGAGGRIETGVVLAERYRIVFGFRTDETLSAARQVRDGADCVEYRDFWGRRRFNCRDTFRTTYDDQRGASQVYLDLAANLTERLRLFARGGYAVYRVTDFTGRDRSSRDGAWQLMFGGSYRVGF